MSKNLPDNLFETPNTPIKEFFEEIDPGARYSDEAVALFALVKEVQTLNEILKEALEDETGQPLPLETLLKRVFWASDEGGWRHDS